MIFLNFPFRKDKILNNRKAKVYYAGAETSNIGGPYLKIKKLQKFFPEICLQNLENHLWANITD